MKFTANKKTLASALSQAAEATGKGSMSVLQTVLITLNGNKLELTATDIKTWLHTSIEVDGHADGQLAVFADKLTAILSNLPDGNVQLSYDNNQLTLKPDSKKATYKLATLAGKQFPELPKMGEGVSFTIAGRELSDMIGKTIYASSFDETRYFMNAVCFESADGKLRLIATDGRRMAMVEGTSVPGFTDALVPIKPLAMLLKRNIMTDITVNVTEKHILFDVAGFQIGSALIEGQFPNYRKVIPTGYTDSLTVDRQEFSQAIKRVSVLTDGKAQKMRFEIKGSTLVLSSEGMESGEAVEELEVEATKDMVFFLNYSYMSDMLKTINDKAVIKYGEAGRAVMVEDGGYISIIMPMSE
jgi:DNA polymerase-3 subunit beta